MDTGMLNCAAQNLQPVYILMEQHAAQEHSSQSFPTGVDD